MPDVGAQRHPFFPVQHGDELPTKRRVVLGVALALVVVLLAVRIAANPIAATSTQRALDDLTGYDGTFASVNVSFFPPAYGIHDLQLVHDGDTLVFIESLDARVDWKTLFRGRLRGDVVAQHAKFTLDLQRNDIDFTSALDEVVPFKLDRFSLRDSEIELIGGDTKLRVKDVAFTVENLDENAPLLMAGRGRVANAGVLSLFFVADILDGKPAISGQAQLSGLQLESLADWAKAKAGVSPRGTLFLGVNVNTVKTNVTGDVEIIAWDVKVDGLLESLLGDIKAGIANIAFKVLADEGENRRASVRLPLRVDLNNVHPKVWPTVLGVVSTSFINAVDFGFGAPPIIDLKRAGDYPKDGDRLVFSKNARDVMREDGIRALQKKLNVMEDGVLTAETQRAIGSFQRAEKLTETGMPDYATVKRLGVDPQRVFRRDWRR